MEDGCKIKKRNLELKLKENEDLFIFGEDSFVMVYSQKFTTNWS
jgi:hypothetical protein